MYVYILIHVLEIIVILMLMLLWQGLLKTDPELQRCTSSSQAESTSDALCSLISHHSVRNPRSSAAGLHRR